MKDIKFRVYDKDLKKMRYLQNQHDFIEFDEEGNAIYLNMQTGYGEWFSDLMQYTGLKDKNGVEIYEGDKVIFHHKTWYKKNKERVYDYKNTKCYIFWDSESASFILNKNPNKVTDKSYVDVLCMFDGDTIEVIGNIYDNPELLEGDK